MYDELTQAFSLLFLIISEEKSESKQQKARKYDVFQEI